MIVPMKKVTLITLDKDAEYTVQALRQLGLLHVQHEQAPKGENITNLQEKLSLTESAIAVLSIKEFASQVSLQKDKPLTDWVFTPLETIGRQEKDMMSLTGFTARYIIDLKKRIEQLEEFATNLLSRINQQENWGDFSPEAIEELSQKNIFVRLYQLPLKEMHLIPKGVMVKKLSTAGSIANCAIISYGKVEIPFKEVPLPKMGLDKLCKRLAQDTQVIESLKEELANLVGYREEFLKIKRSLESELEFHQAIRGMGQSGALTYITGYTPFDKVESVVQMAKKEKWGLVVREPSEEDRVPTLIRNPRLISIISPIFKIIEVVPGYRELDISLWFLLFFSVFFGMLIGDAGYGSIFFILTFFSQKKWGRKLQDKSIFVLFYILSTCAVLWGVLSGTFFGQEWLSQSVRPIIPGLRNDKYVQAFCFFLGALHLSIAHCWRLLIKLPSLMALADMGWILILWGAFFLARLLILGDAFPEFGKWLFIGGIGLVVFFTRPSKNILKGIGSGLGNLLLNLVNNFTDIVSYIRLFAVGLATVAVADSFNKMAMSIGYNSIITGLFTSFILLLGHLLNVMLGPMSILVHGVRLNVLEFCNHLDIKWMGFPYRPLQAEKAD